MDFIERLYQEKQELSEKLQKLNTFVDDGRISQLPASDKALLLTQRSIMWAYMNILTERLRLIEERQGHNSSM